VPLVDLHGQHVEVIEILVNYRDGKPIQQGVYVVDHLHYALHIGATTVVCDERKALTNGFTGAADIPVVGGWQM
jgi:hypothetical protein